MVEYSLSRATPPAVRGNKADEPTRRGIVRVLGAQHCWSATECAVSKVRPREIAVSSPVDVEVVQRATGGVGDVDLRVKRVLAVDVAVDLSRPKATRRRGHCGGLKRARRRAASAHPGLADRRELVTWERPGGRTIMLAEVRSRWGGT